MTPTPTPSSNDNAAPISARNTENPMSLLSAENITSKISKETRDTLLSCLDLAERVATDEDELGDVQAARAELEALP